MEEKNKGFTLIELLAVIVILAIIALIAVPIVMNLITKARLSAAKDSAYGVLKSAQNYYAEKLIDTQGAGFEDVTFTCNGEECFYQGEEKETLKINGTIPTSGTIAVTSTLGAKLTSPLVINDYYCDYVDESDTVIDCSTTMKDLTNSGEITEEERMLKIYPVGSIYISTTDTNPSELFGGTWEAYGEGRTLVGVGEGTDQNSTTQAFTIGQTGGEYKHTQTVEEMPSHSHSTNIIVAPSGTDTYSGVNRNGNDIYYDGSDGGLGANGYSHYNITRQSLTKTSTSTGSNTAFNVTQPYIAVYMFRRVS